MKLLLIITDYGSFNNFLSELAISIVEKPNFELHVACSNQKVIAIADKLTSTNGKITFHFVNIPRSVTIKGEWQAAKKIRNLIDQIKPDLIHAHFTTATFPAILFKNVRYQYWATIHGLGMNSTSGLKKVIFTLVEMLCFYRLNKIFTVNNDDYLLVSKLFRKKVKKHICLGFGCDINKFNAANVPATSLSQLKLKYGITTNHTVLAFTGRFVSFKGFDLVVKSFKLLSEQHPNKFKLILIGGQDPIHQTGLSIEETHFLDNSKDIINTGFTSDVEIFLSLGDIFVFPSKKEGLPTCVLEALSMGLPVITFNTRGNNDIIKHRYNGLLLDPCDSADDEVEQIIEQVSWMAENPDQLFEFKNNALRHRADYSRMRFVNEQISYYDQFSYEAI